ncbi:uncharacterized protein LOC113174957 isoform X1 [Anabas testudineus]|uniref:uncharacterized protein LOC113174957 isoform X1 n=1 Tax=Anabas testudineus TaxID=64144 RepID=UPI000E463D3E|nr:uncharacterized protein LOC113174957 isoform X1 [Anabas testudineus]
MAPSPVSGIKMKNLLVGVMLGFLAAVHSTPVDAGILTKDESDVLRESMKDEFLIPSLTTPIPKRNTTVQAFQQQSLGLKKSEMIESNPTENDKDHYVTTIQSASKAQSATSTVPLVLNHLFTKDILDLGSGDGELQKQFTTTLPSVKFSPRKEASAALSPSTAPPVTTGSEAVDSGSVKAEELSELTSAEKTNRQSFVLTHPFSTDILDLGSGDEKLQKQYTTTLSSVKFGPAKEARASLSTSTAPPLTTGSEEVESGLGSGKAEELSEFTAAEKTNAQFFSLNHPFSTDILDLGSGHEELQKQYTTTLPSVPSSPGKEASAALSTSTEPPVTTGSEAVDSGSKMSEELSERTVAEKTNAQSFSLNHPFSTDILDLGSGHEELQKQYTTTLPSVPSSPGKEASTSLSTSTASPLTTRSEKVDSENDEDLSKSIIVKTERKQNYSPIGDSPQKAGHSTPGWIIILVGIVGIAALVIVCVAVVTKERWYGPNQVSQLETKTSQQRELEMETFLHEDRPRENEKTTEYTVIPLDDLPETYTSH